MSKCDASQEKDAEYRPSPITRRLNITLDLHLLTSHPFSISPLQIQILPLGPLKPASSPSPFNPSVMGKD